MRGVWFIIAAVVLAACAPEPTATVDLQATVDASVARALQTAVPATATPTPTPTATPTATPTPTPTPTPTTTPTVTPTPTPEPTPTPSPSHIIGRCIPGGVVFEGERPNNHDVLYNYWFLVGGLQIIPNFDDPQLPYPFHADGTGPWQAWASNIWTEQELLLASGECAAPTGAVKHIHGPTIPPGICDVEVDYFTTTVVPGCPTPTPTPTPTPLPPIVATERAWDCFFEYECGWDQRDATFWLGILPIWYYKRAPKSPVMVTGEPGAIWLEPLEEALQRVGDLTGVEYFRAEDTNDPRWLDVALVFDFLPTSDNPGPCMADPSEDVWACAHMRASQDEPNALHFREIDDVRYAYGGRITVAAHDLGQSAADRRDLLMHELLHIYGFGHITTGGIMEPGWYGSGLTARDVEMLQLYAALPDNTYLTKIREAACIGRNGVCERMYFP